MRTYRPVPETLRVWMPPVPVVVVKIEVQFTASGDVWIWNALPYAVSQFSVTWQIVWLDPRSTCSHCGSLKALDQRVPGLPSTAFAAGNVAFSVDDALAGLPCDNRVDAALARLAGPATSARAAASARTTPRSEMRRQAKERGACVSIEPIGNSCLREAIPPCECTRLGLRLNSLRNVTWLQPAVKSLAATSLMTGSQGGRRRLAGAEPPYRLQKILEPVLLSSVVCGVSWWPGVVNFAAALQPPLVGLAPRS